MYSKIIFLFVHYPIDAQLSNSFIFFLFFIAAYMTTMLHMHNAFTGTYGYFYIIYTYFVHLVWRTSTIHTHTHTHDMTIASFFTVHSMVKRNDFARGKFSTETMYESTWQIHIVHLMCHTMIINNNDNNNNHSII